MFIAQIHGRANYAADFLLRLQKNCETTLSLELSNKILLKKIEINTTAETSDVSLNSTKCIADQFEN